MKYKEDNVKFFEYDLWVEELDEDREYVERFRTDELLNNKLTLINETRDFTKWNYTDAAHLWNFNVHYMEYLVALKARYKTTANETYKGKINEILEDWYINGVLEDDSNAAYTISLRIVNLLLVADTVTEKQRLYDSIYAQYQFLLNHQEKHLLGNHYLENLKAIVICSIVFGDDNAYRKNISKLKKELDEEITPDGLHFELSMMYHKIVVEDIIRVAMILKQAGKAEYDQMLKYLSRMGSALYSLEGGINRTLLFNDAGKGVSKSTVSLLRTLREQFGMDQEYKSAVSGYYRINEGNISIVVDCGELSPRYMPGHSHCDCLSYELFYDGVPVLVNSGTYQYQGEQRSYYRSTGAHNTVVINDHEQSELWGEHRAGRRIGNIRASLTDNGKTLKGGYTSFCKEDHERKISLLGGVLQVTDVVKGKAKSYLHIAPDVRYNNKMMFGKGFKAKIITIDSEIREIESVYAPDFGVAEINTTLVFEWDGNMREHGYKIEIQEV